MVNVVRMQYKELDICLKLNGVKTANEFMISSRSPRTEIELRRVGVLEFKTALIMGQADL